MPGAEFDAVSLHASVGAKLGPGTPRLTSLFIREDPGTLCTSDGTQVADERFADSIAAVEEILMVGGLGLGALVMRRRRH